MAFSDWVEGFTVYPGIPGLLLCGRHHSTSWGFDKERQKLGILIPIKIAEQEIGKQKNQKNVKAIIHTVGRRP